MKCCSSVDAELPRRPAMVSYTTYTMTAEKLPMASEKIFNCPEGTSQAAGGQKCSGRGRNFVGLSLLTGRGSIGLLDPAEKLKISS